IERLVREAKRLSSLVLELLDASRAERGLLVGERQAVDLAEVAAEVCARQDASRCTLQASEPLVGVFDRTRIAQLLDNLVENAIKYSPPHELVAVRVWREGDEARLSVTDRGIGIPPADLPHIFDRFYRAGNV